MKDYNATLAVSGVGKLRARGARGAKFAREAIVGRSVTAAGRTQGINLDRLAMFFIDM
jgi:hypothetical protein